MNAPVHDPQEGKGDGAQLGLLAWFCYQAIIDRGGALKRGVPRPRSPEEILALIEQAQPPPEVPRALTDRDPELKGALYNMAAGYTADGQAGAIAFGLTSLASAVVHDRPVLSLWGAWTVASGVWLLAQVLS